MEKPHRFDDGDLHIEFYHDMILFSNPKLLKVVPDRSLEDFYDLVEYYIYQATPL
ncbi:hypothetical protein LASUN_16340 [Lentilactobacillus sunkii]|jgi:hypothetical protein|uniref:Uncharacterized protein n=1 Tax=Lentilactobacillus sunkii TaxID=481719 RepID=A0A1E7XC87_9LACO|nr:hypothetical protein LASUN_16340 [Lentilactobacillus sunkii]